MAESANTVRNEDWLRTRSWDLYTSAGTKVTTLAALLPAIYATGTPAEQRAALRRFMALPSAEAMPAGLRAEVDDFLAGGR